MDISRYTHQYHLHVTTPTECSLFDTHGVFPIAAGGAHLFLQCLEAILACLCLLLAASHLLGGCSSFLTVLLIPRDRIHKSSTSLVSTRTNPFFARKRFHKSIGCCTNLFLLALEAIQTGLCLLLALLTGLSQHTHLETGETHQHTVLRQKSHLPNTALHQMHAPDKYPILDPTKETVREPCMEEAATLSGSALRLCCNVATWRQGCNTA